MSLAPRRTCPACSRRYAGLVADECPVCQGLGVLALGAAALHHYEAPAVARAAELYLEHAAQEATRTLTLGDRRQALEAATDELRVAGVLAGPMDTYTRAPVHVSADVEATDTLERRAVDQARQLGRQPTRLVVAALAAKPVPDLAPHRPRNGNVPTASLNGHLAAVAVIADPIDPIGPDVAQLEERQRVDNYRARVIAAAVPQAAKLRAPAADEPATREPQLIGNVADLRLEYLKRQARAHGVAPVSNKALLIDRLAAAGVELIPAHTG